MLCTDKQRSYIHKLLNDLGYTTQKIHQTAFIHYTEEKYMTGNASTVIEKLLEEVSILRHPKKRKVLSKYYTATGLAEFAFCPASYSIKNSLYLPKTIEEEEGLLLHSESYLEEFLKNVFNKRKRKYESGDGISDKRNLKKIYSGNYGELLSSKIIYKGHIEEKKILYSSKGKLAGSPDYIFERNDGSKFVLEEKHTWQDLVERPWLSNLIQVLAYVYGIKYESVEFDKGYLLYFSWTWFNRKRYTKNARLFKVDRNKQNYGILVDVFSKVKEFRNRGKIHFDTKSLNPSKCLKCSSKIFCKHKAGRLNEINYPYYKR